MNPTPTHFDFLIIGSGFGGSVSALRLSQKGYKVGIIESGKRWGGHNEYPLTNWNIRKFFWFPKLGFHGFQNMTLIKGLLLLHGTGVGGGSLVYANTLMVPDPEVFKSWPIGRNWFEELSQKFLTAKRALGVTTNPAMKPAEEALKRLGQTLKVEKTFHPTEVGVYFGQPEIEVPDPYFGGEGPSRVGCRLCGGCMVGCRYNSKNTLDKNYLYLAEKWGTVVFDETQAEKIVPQEKGYQVHTYQSTTLFKKNRRILSADRVIVAAGVLGTLKLLFANRDVHGTLPHLSPQLGREIRTNGESLLGLTRPKDDVDFSQGIAIGAAIHPDEYTKIEAVKYPAGSSVMKLLAVPLTDTHPPIPRALIFLWRCLVRLPQNLRLLFVKDWAKQSIILLVMQTIDRKIHLNFGRSFWTFFGKGLVKAPGSDSIPSYLPVAQKAVKAMSRDLGAEPQNVIAEVLLSTPTTAHILGGACLAKNSQEGVIDFQHQVFGHPGLYVCDGSVIPANLGVNPSLTIAALAERFADQFPVHSQLSRETYEHRCRIFPN